MIIEFKIKFLNAKSSYKHSRTRIYRHKQTNAHSITHTSEEILARINVFEFQSQK